MLSSDVSIIIPMHVTNQEQYGWFVECVESALMQDMAYVVIFDDGGDESYYNKLLSKYKKSDRKNSMLISRDAINHGVSYARNQAVGLAITDMILPLDGDDKLTTTAVTELLSVWNGVPVYPDITKFGEENVPHYALLDFDCDHILTHVGFTSVNVLHSKSQWNVIGGWNEGIEFYEDGEYNARLFGRFCGVRYPKPLVQYRIHSQQRTKKYDKVSGNYARLILNKIRGMNMACPGCRKNRATSISATQVMQATAATSKVDINSLPLMSEDKVLALYVGGQGKGKHYYRGMVSGYPYKVSYGDAIYVYEADTRLESNGADPKQFIKVVRAAEPVQQVVKAEPTEPVATEAPIIRKSALAVSKAPVK